MKKLLYLSFVALLFASCDMKDKGNYTYQDDLEVFPVEIAELDGLGDLTFNAGSHVYYEPTFEVMDDESKYLYRWYAVKVVNALQTVFLLTKWDDSDLEGVDPEDLDDLMFYQDTPALDIIWPNYPEFFDGGSAAIFFEVYDPVRKLRVKKEKGITFSSSPLGSHGVYVLKQVSEGFSDIDYFALDRATGTVNWQLSTNAEDLLKPAEPTYIARENVITYRDIVKNGSTDNDDPEGDLGMSGLGAPLSGNPIGLEFNEGKYYYMFDGNLKTKDEPGAVYVLTDNNIYALSRMFNEVYNEGENIIKPSFLPDGPLAPKWMGNTRIFKNGGVGSAKPAAVIMNINDHIYGATALTASPELMTGGLDLITFSLADVASYAGAITGGTYALFFNPNPAVDQIQLFNALSGEVSTPAISGTNSEPFANKEVTVVKMLEYTNTSPTNSGQDLRGLSIFKHKTNGNGYLVRTDLASVSTSSNIYSWIHPIDPAADILDPSITVMSSGQRGGFIVYYAKGNEIWSYVDHGQTTLGAGTSADDCQKLQLTLGAGETVVDIFPITYVSSRSTTDDHAGYSYNWLTVLVNKSGGGYKYYAFKLNGDTVDILPTPELEFEGTGVAKKSLTRFHYMMK